MMPTTFKLLHLDLVLSALKYAQFAREQISPTHFFHASNRLGGRHLGLLIVIFLPPLLPHYTHKIHRHLLIRLARPALTYPVLYK